MVSSTPINGLRMAELSDPANMQTAMSQIGTDLDNRLFPRFATPVARDSAITSPVEGQMCYVVSYHLPMIYYTSFWGFMPGCLVGSFYTTGAQTIATGTDTAVNFDSEHGVDPMGAHSTSVNTSRFTPTVPGRYEFSGGTSLQATAAGNRLAWFAVNGSPMFGPGDVQVGNATYDTVLRVTAEYGLNGTTDYIQLMMSQSSGGNLNTVVSTTIETPALRVTYVSGV